MEPPSRPRALGLTGLPPRHWQEPFWPEGLGVNRGMHNALDSSWIAHKWMMAQGTATLEEELLAERQYLYQEFTLQMHGARRGGPLQGPARAARAPYIHGERRPTCGR